MPEWPREESNLRPQIRSLLLYPLSYGASMIDAGSMPAEALLLRSLLGFLRVAHVGDEHPDDCGIELLPGEAHQLVQSITG